MIYLREIHTKDKELYAFMENLLIKTFPVGEYRELKMLRHYTDNRENFHNHIIFDNKRPVGLITIWNLNDFNYVEHFAILPDKRNKGYGKRVINLIEKGLKKPVVLEVELPEDKIAIRRIEFYKRLNFKLWEVEYNQPPYKSGEESIPMFLMIYGELIKGKDYFRVKNKLHKEIYGVTENTN